MGGARPPVHLIGVPLDLGGGRRGVDMGPSALRIAGLGERLGHLGLTVVDRGNLAVPIAETRVERHPAKRYIREIARVCQQLYQQTSAVLDLGALPLVLGGDHSLAAGSVGATADHAARRDLPIGLLWLDAHADMNTPGTTTSGNVHGMPLAALLGDDPSELARVGSGRVGKVRAEHTALVGVRSVDALESERLRESGVHVFTMKDIDRIGIAAVMDRAIGTIAARTAGVHLSLDMDVCDPAIAPGVGTPVRGGLTYREAHLAMEMIADTGRLVAVDLVEVNPILDIGNQTAILGTELLLSALGQRIL